MLYSRCAICGAPVYRYRPNSPVAGEMGNRTQNCWAVHHTHPDDHHPIWEETQVGDYTPEGGDAA